jgi:Mrp family chromosome partitioning ATPase
MPGTKKRTNAAFFSIAARVETELASPAVLLVTSALDTDGTMMVSANLAQALVVEGYRVAVVDGRKETDEPEALRRPLFGHEKDVDGVQASRTYGEIALRDLGETFAGSRRDVVALVERLRARYDYVIVSAPSFNRGSMPTLFAHACDGMLITVVKDRLATADDQRINAFLDGGSKPVVGIVSTTKSAVDNFEQSAHQRPRLVLPANDIADERVARVPVVLGTV